MFRADYLRAMIVVTGAAGFIGSVLAVRLLEANYRQVVLVDDFSVEAKRPNHERLPVTERVDRGPLSSIGCVPTKTRSSSSFISAPGPTQQSKTRRC